MLVYEDQTSSLFFYQIHSPDDVWPGGVHFWCWGGQTAGLPVSLWQVHMPPSDKFITLKLNLKQGMLYNFNILQKSKLRNQNTKRNVELSPQLQELPFKLGGDWLAGILLHRDAGAVLFIDLT